MTAAATTRQSSLPRIWTDFNRALRSPQPFNPIFWIYELGRAGVDHFYVTSGCVQVVDKYELKKRWRPWIPLFGLTLIVLVDIAYVLSLRDVILLEWCCPVDPFDQEYQSNTARMKPETTDDYPCEGCGWMNLHDFLVCYLSLMLIFHYCATVFQSPGVVLPRTDERFSWKAIDGQGGMVGLRPVFDEKRERKLVALYGQLKAENREVHGNNLYFPSFKPSFCEKCQHWRPPRCHHCSLCGRCVLQFDHHCIWLNQCIGYNNYRSFFLMLFFLALSCWYGSFVLFPPFFRPLKLKVEQEGLRVLYSNSTGPLNPLPPHKFIYQIYSGTLPQQVLVDMLFPLFFGLGAIITSFFAFHLHYILHARTTLEQHMILEDILVEILRYHRKPSSTRVINPYDQGWKRNLKQILGSNLLLLFLPVNVEPAPPFLPTVGKKV